MASGVAFEEPVPDEPNSTSAFKAIEVPPRTMASARDPVDFAEIVVVYNRRGVVLIGRDRE
jgi:hypothetical protein